MKRLGLLLPLVLVLSPANAADLAAVQQALNIIEHFADEFCKTPPLEGWATEAELSGRAKAELNGLLKKMANLGLEGGGKYQSDQYRGLLQKDLANVYRDSSNCRLAVWKDLKDKLIPAERKAPSFDSAKQPKSNISTQQQELIQKLKQAEEERHRLEDNLRLVEAEREAEAAVRSFNLRNKPSIDVTPRQIHTIALLFRENARAEEIDAYLELCQARVGLVALETPGALTRIRSTLDAAAQVAVGSNVGSAIQGKTRKERLQSFADLIERSVPLDASSVDYIRRHALRYPSLTLH